MKTIIIVFTLNENTKHILMVEYKDNFMNILLYRELNGQPYLLKTNPITRAKILANLYCAEKLLNES